MPNYAQPDWLTPDDDRRDDPAAALIQCPVLPDALKVYLQGAYGDLKMAARNWATGKQVGIVGAPVANDNMIICTGATHYIRLEEFEQDAGTIFIVAPRSDTAADNNHRGVLAATFLGATDLGFLVYWTDANNIRVQFYQTDGGNPAVITLRGFNLAIPNPTLIKKLQLQWDAAGVTLTNKTDNQSGSIAFTQARYKGSRAICVGSAPSSSFKGIQKIGPFAYFPLKLTDQQCDDMWANQVGPWMTDDDLVENT